MVPLLVLGVEDQQIVHVSFRREQLPRTFRHCLQPFMLHPSTCSYRHARRIRVSHRDAFDLSPNPYISELTWENPLPSADWRSQKSDPIVIHKQGFTYEVFGTLREKFSSLSDQISSVENQLIAVKKETQEWRKEVAFDFNVILVVAIIFTLIFSFVR